MDFSIAMETKSPRLLSPDGRLGLEVTTGDRISYSLSAGERKLIEPSALSIKLSADERLGVKPVLREASAESVRKTITPPFYKRKEIKDEYNRLLLRFAGEYALEFRAYNDGMAYRFITSRRGTIEVLDEQCEFNFGKDYEVWAQYVNRWGRAINITPPLKTHTPICP